MNEVHSLSAKKRVLNPSFVNERRLHVFQAIRFKIGMRFAR